jgi:hypothetical protein
MKQINNKNRAFFSDLIASYLEVVTKPQVIFEGTT